MPSRFRLHKSLKQNQVLQCFTPVFNTWVAPGRIYYLCSEERPPPGAGQAKRPRRLSEARSYPEGKRSALVPGPVGASRRSHTLIPKGWPPSGAGHGTRGKTGGGDTTTLSPYHSRLHTKYLQGRFLFFSGREQEPSISISSIWSCHQFWPKWKKKHFKQP